MTAYVKLFWQEDCPRCGSAKEICNKLVKSDPSMHLKLFDITTIDGMTEAAFHEVISTPTTLILDDKENEISAWRGDAPSFEEIEQKIKDL